jgi:hypothetical protein
MLKKIITVIIITVITFSGLPSLCAQEYCCKPAYLSPQLQLQTRNMIAMCETMFRRVSLLPQAGIPGQENPDYVSFLPDLIESASPEVLPDIPALKRNNVSDSPAVAIINSAV